jgi:hypothetical protein
MNPAAVSLDGHALAARYEALRQDVVASGTCRHAVYALALFVRKGMAAWMKSVEEESLRDAAVGPLSPDGSPRRCNYFCAANIPFIGP